MVVSYGNLMALAKQWHESETGLISDLDDYWEVAPSWNQEGVPKKLKGDGDFTYGLSPVQKRRLGHRHTIFSKKSPRMSAVITQYIASQFAHHLDFALAPLLFGPNTSDTHSLRMVFNERSGSLYEAIVEKLKRSASDVPKALQDRYDDHMAYKKERGKPERGFPLMSLAQLARDDTQVAQWRDDFRNSVYSRNKEAVSKWAAFMAMVDDSKSTGNIGNVIVSLNDPAKTLYFIDSHPNLQRGSSDLVWGAKGKHRPVSNDGNFFLPEDVNNGAIDLESVAQELEGFKEKLTDEAIDDTIFKASALMGRLLADKRYGEPPQYFIQLRDFYKSRRDTLTCEF